MSLGDFLHNDAYGSWADEMEDIPTIPSTGERTGYGNRRNDYGNNRMGGGFGGGAGRDRDDGYSRRPDLPLPTKPPYTAHVGNLSFDATEDDISMYFAECSISSVRLVRDRMGDRPKGFGYVEFETLDGLKKALELNNGQLAGRNVRVSVADPPKDRADDRTNVDTWRRSGPLSPAEPPQMRRTNSRFNDNSSEAGGDNFSRRGSGFGGRDRGDRGDRGERGERGDRGDRGDRESEAGDGKFRDFNNWERKGPLPPPTPTDTQSESGRPPRHERGGDRRRSPAVNPWDRERQPSLQGEERAERGDRGDRPDRPKREYQRPPAPERVQTAAEKDDQWRASLTRPKLELKKRSEALPVDANQPAPAADSKASPFGAARPIDTSAREKEVEEKKLRLAAEKKEKEEKEKEEKKAAARLAGKSERGERKGSVKGDNGEPETPTTAKNFDILRRTSAVTATDDANPTEPEPEESSETKKELKQPTKAAPKVSLPQEDDGWSTVKRGRGTNGKV
ncbi:hypothetical protein ABW20_dc0110269 [Dactylellina cionopaga]|nr:hypothetical protein ABW20_dc0110269 [Dactylellina cionopaga]